MRTSPLCAYGMAQLLGDLLDRRTLAALPARRAHCRALAQLDTADLATDRLGQLADELDLARVFVGRGLLAHERLQLGRQCLRRLVAGRENDEGLDDLAANLIGVADDRRLGDGRMLLQRALDLER